MKNFIKESMPYVIIVILVIIIRSFIITPVVVRGESMDNTLVDGEVLFLSKISYHIHDIKRFDVVVIRDKDNDLIIKRIIGLPGDNVKYKDNQLYINNEIVSDNYSNGETENFDLQTICMINNDECVSKIPEDMYLVLGDNREVSADSRVKGLFKRDVILGKAVFRIWPFNRIKIIH
ncbi:MAG: signal peptidase I [Bacilli bacterium]|nr:signal peptidase I [Bacilli bacterium]